MCGECLHAILPFQHVVATVTRRRLVFKGVCKMLRSIRFEDLSISLMSNLKKQNFFQEMDSEFEMRSETFLNVMRLREVCCVLLLSLICVVFMNCRCVFGLCDCGKDRHVDDVCCSMFALRVFSLHNRW